MVLELKVGDDCVVHERAAVRCKVTKVARVYLTVEGGRRSWEFDKTTGSPRGDHCGYVPQLRTIAEHERLVAWEVMKSALRDLPFQPPHGANVESIRRVTAAALALTEGT